MSHYSALKTVFRDAACLASALGDLGYKAVEVHEKPQPLVGYQGDYRDRDDWGRHTNDVARAVTAEVIVRRAHVGPAANDLGFARAADGAFRAIVSDYDRRRHDDLWLAKLTQRYNLHVDKKKAKSMGYHVAESALPSGAIKLTLTR
jgi:hypothetical protein